LTDRVTLKCRGGGVQCLSNFRAGTSGCGELFLLERHDCKLRAVGGALLEFDCEKSYNPTCGRDDGVKNKITKLTEPPSLRYVSSRSDIECRHYSVLYFITLGVFLRTWLTLTVTSR